MKKNEKLYLLAGGLGCALLMTASAWYTLRCNDARLLAPMEWSEYTFRMRDLPMLASGILLALYLLGALVLVGKEVLVKKGKKADARFTRAVSPKMGFLGFLGFAGFLGFWTYSVDKTVFPFLFFMFFGYFGFFYEGKMSHTFMDERYRENKIKAHLAANKTALGVIFLAALLLGQGRLLGNLEYNLIALLIVVALSVALDTFLTEYLLYRYDHEDGLEESEE